VKRWKWWCSAMLCSFLYKNFLSNYYSSINYYCCNN